MLTDNNTIITPKLVKTIGEIIVPDLEQEFSVPKSWCWVKQGAVSTFINGRAYKQAELLEDQTATPVLRVGNLFTNGSWYYSNLSLEASKYIDNGDLIYAWSASFGPFIWEGGRVIYHYHIWKITLTKALIKKYYYYWLMHDTERLKKQGHGTGMIHVTKEMMESSAIPLPPLPEQQRIVDRIESLFTKLDEAKEIAQAVVDGFEDRKAAILHKAFAGELTSEWRKKNGAKINAWKKVVLSDVCTINPPKANVKELPDYLEVSFFPMPALSEIYGAITEPQTRQLGEVRTGFTNFSEGDVVFAKITPCMENGKTAIIGPLVNHLGYGTTEFFVCRCSDKLYNRYLWHMFRDQHFRNEAKAVMSGAVGQQRVPKSFLENYRIELPSVAEQHEIVAALDTMFEKELTAKEASEAIIEQINDMKKTILARAFRGELGTNDPNDESAIEFLRKILK